ncbi:MAG: hypothetical protein IIC75_00350 [Bacteroidetes bacterium]|nr:hypothetical protein [Bacteroidota bacterium]
MGAGRPPKFKTVEALERALEKYFVECEEQPTISGLAHHLGFLSRQSIYDFHDKKNPKFSYTIKRAILEIENKHEKGLYDQSNAGHIFWLKNRGWTDQQSIDSNITITVKREKKPPIEER